MTTYEIHRLTGSVLVDASGRGYAPESGGVVSAHRTEVAARKQLDKLDSLGGGINSGKYEIRAAKR